MRIADFGFRIALLMLLAIGTAAAQATLTPVQEFRNTVKCPATNTLVGPDGACAGWVPDWIIPTCVGPNAAANIQWGPAANAAGKARLTNMICDMNQRLARTREVRVTGPIGEFTVWEDEITITCRGSLKAAVPK